jgi:LPXTG-motif cell wall-anchored protein
MKKFSFKALSFILLSSAIILTGVAPAHAGTFGELIIINPTGGTSTTDGLKIHIASSQFQVTRNGVGQLYDKDEVPSPDGRNIRLDNNFQVSYTSGGTNYIIGRNGTEWSSGTSSSALSGDSKSGTVVNTVTATAPTGGSVSLEVTFSYTYPDQFFNISTKLTLPSGWTNPTRLHWNADATLGGSDDGDQFEGVLSSGQQVRGVISPDGTQIEGFRQVIGQSVFSWAGSRSCATFIIPVLSDDDDLEQLAECPENSPGDFRSGWLRTNNDAPNSISAETNIDNGFGVSTPVVSSAGTHTATFDLLFVGCLAGEEDLQCINENIPAPVATTTPATTIPATTAPAAALATTGANLNWLFVAGLFAVVAGSGFLAFSRRKRIW